MFLGERTDVGLFPLLLYKMPKGKKKHKMPPKSRFQTGFDQMKVHLETAAVPRPRLPDIILRNVSRPDESKTEAMTILLRAIRLFIPLSETTQWQLPGSIQLELPEVNDVCKPYRVLKNV